MISDDGPGIAPDMLKRIGEPYVSRRRSADDAQSEHHGLGLGVFIARTLLERTGAKVSFANRTFPGSRRRGADRLAAQPLRDQRNRGRTGVLGRLTMRMKARRSDFMWPWQRRIATPYAMRVEHEDDRILNAIAELTGHADRSLLIVEATAERLEGCRARWKPAASR